MTTDTLQEETNNANTENWTYERLDNLSLKELFNLFYRLSAPSIQDMNGEFEAATIHNGSLFTKVSSILAVKNPLTDGIWLNKSFQPVDTNYGHGYNTFRKFGKEVRKYPMKTSIANSRYDGKPIYQLDYTAYDSLLGKINMVDEIRRLDDTHYLGIGTAGFSDKQRQRPMPFLLTGPYRDFVGADKTHEKKPPRFTQ